MTARQTEDDLLAEAVEWRLRVDEDPDSPKLQAALQAWLAKSNAHRTAYRDVDRLTRLAEALPAGYDDTQRSAVPAAVSPAIATRPARGLRRPALFGALALAACLALWLAPAVRIWTMSDYRTDTAELRTITLDDGSVVSLDAGSAIAVHYEAARRKVTLLAGRAFFEVVLAAARPFVVEVDDATVTVTGTSFDVRSSAEATSVAVRTGTVQVAQRGNEDQVVVLTAGERLDIDRRARALARSSVVAGDIAAWRERRLVVDRATIAEVTEELGRHYRGVVISTDGALSKRRVSGVFDLRQPVEALEAAVRLHDGSITRVTPYVVVVNGR